MMLPDYQRVNDAEPRAQFEELWDTRSTTKPGLTVVEIMASAGPTATHEIRGMYIMGENPAMSDPDVEPRARGAGRARASGGAGHLPHRDRVATPTSCCRPPAWPEKDGTVTNTNRMVQMGRAALPPPGDAQARLVWIIQEIGAPHRAATGNYEDPRDVFTEMRQCMRRRSPASPGSGSSASSSVTYPVRRGRTTRATPRGLRRQLPDRPTGRVKLVPAGSIPPAEAPDADYPMVLITGRQLEHWHTGVDDRGAPACSTTSSRAPSRRVAPAATCAGLGVAPANVITRDVAPRHAWR